MSTLIEDFHKGDRKALAKIITLVESEAINNKEEAHKILTLIRKPKNNTLRLAISGPPGVGKSTFINKLAQHFIAHGLKVAVLAIDPASEVNQGSLLADKTRMLELLSNPHVFIRPSSSRGVMGGVHKALYDVIYVSESFGFDCVIIETIGVGQSEALASSVADHFIVLMQPAAGDSLQAMKKGILEIADFILVNKADGDLKAHAKKSLAALHGLRAEKALISALYDEGIDNFVNVILAKHSALLLSEELFLRRELRLQKFFSFALKENLWPKLWEKARLEQKQQSLLKSLSHNHEALGPLIDMLTQHILQQYNGIQD
jgi:LAO/AO transport system kinase